jgi:hypothetical protein
MVWACEAEKNKKKINKIETFRLVAPMNVSTAVRPTVCDFTERMKGNLVFIYYG